MLAVTIVHQCYGNEVTQGGWTVCTWPRLAALRVGRGIEKQSREARVSLGFVTNWIFWTSSGQT
jgi:hypothetical protein